MNITAVQKYCVDTFEKYSQEWPLMVKAGFIGAVVYKTLGASATAVYIATAFVLYHKHEYLIKQISQINYKDAIFCVIAAVSPFFGMYGICGNVFLVIGDVINRNIQFYKISALHDQTLEKLKLAEAKNSEIHETLDAMLHDSEIKISDYSRRIEQVDGTERECQALLEKSQKLFSEILQSLQEYTAKFGSPEALKQKIDKAEAHIESIKSSLESNRNAWQILTQGCNHV